MKARKYSSSFEYGYNNYDIAYPKVLTEVHARKIGINSALGVGQFSFGLFRERESQSGQ